MENKKSIVNYEDDDDDGQSDHETKAHSTTSDKPLVDSTGHKYDNTEKNNEISKDTRSTRKDNKHHKNSSHHSSSSVDCSHSTKHHSRSSKVHRHRSKSPSPSHRRRRRSRSRSRSRDSHHRHHSHRNRRERSRSVTKSRKGNCRKSKRGRSRSRSKESRNYHRRHKSRSHSRDRSSHETTKFKERNEKGEKSDTKPPIVTRTVNNSPVEKKVNVIAPTTINTTASTISVKQTVLATAIPAKLPEIPKYYNSKVVNPIRIATQEEKRKLLWGDGKKDKTSSSTSSVWTNLKFQGEHGSLMTEKFRKLMGIKTSEGENTTANTSGSSDTVAEVCANQDQLFQNLDLQYTMARMSTHTHRGVGLGFGTNNRF